MSIKEQIEINFTYHAPQKGQIVKYNKLREAYKEMALLVADLVPAGRERAIAITKLEESVMFANAGIARSKSDG